MKNVAIWLYGAVVGACWVIAFTIPEEGKLPNIALLPAIVGSIFFLGYIVVEAVNED